MSTLLSARTSTGTATARASASALSVAIPAPRLASEPVSGARHRAEVGVVREYVAATRRDLARPTYVEPFDGAAIRGLVVALAISAPLWMVALLALAVAR